MPPRSITRTCAILLLACGSSAALAMSVRESQTVLARSVAGAMLYEVRAWGPEGGGSLTYRVQGRPARDRVDFLVSSDFSPGDSSRPQTVSPELCRQRLAALATELAKRAISGVTLHPESCRADRRTGLVIRNTPGPEPVE